jgi:hypothetical protein
MEWIRTGSIAAMRRLPFWSLLIVGGLFAYLPALRSFFIKDDLILILSAQTNITTLFAHSWPGGFFRPSAEFLFAIQHALFGLHPLPYHLLSVGAHAATTALLYQILLRLLSDRDQSRIGVLVFALHPLNIESVGWISGQMSLFAGLCTLLLLSLSCNGHPIRLLLPSVIAAIGLGFYESFAATLILWPIVYGYMSHGQKQGRHGRFIIASLLAVLSAAVYLYWRFAVLNLRGGNYAATLSPTILLTNLTYYLYLLLGGSAAGGRILYYQPEQVFSTAHFLVVFPPLLLVSATFIIIVSVIYACDRQATISMPKKNLLPIIWLLVALAPALILPERPRRLTYASIPAFAIFMAGCFSYLLQKKRHEAMLARASLLLYLIVVTTTLHVRNSDWLVASTIEKNIPALLSSAPKCSSLVVDAPNLLGDALFFNAHSTQSWIALSTGRHISLYDAHQFPPQQSLDLQTCLFRYYDGSFVRLDPGEAPHFIRGRNWAPSPHLLPHSEPIPVR